MTIKQLNELRDFKEKAYRRCIDRFLTSNLRKDRYQCLIMKGKLQMLEEIENPKGRYDVIPPKPKPS